MALLFQEGPHGGQGHTLVIDDEYLDVVDFGYVKGEAGLETLPRWRPASPDRYGIQDDLSMARSMPWGGVRDRASERYVGRWLNLKDGRRARAYLSVGLVP
ncbi:MAG: hypothetical protein KJO65_05130, partial [Gemmatimonadetes bacterium]|nr:hypothetical protein [Gemmatimonadota bacterium]